MAKPVLCIVGRPNVGKSTLFNKIVGKRIAITENIPGVTRDRIYADAYWLDNDFTVIDTGGLDPKEDNTFMKNIKNQVEIAVDSADVILFVVDGISGITSTDSDIAQILRKSDKEILLAVNKSDAKIAKDNIYEFYNLGLGEPIAISAENNIGLGDLLDKIVLKFPDMSSYNDEDEKYRIAFIGKPNVGKSSIINKLLGESRLIVTNIPGTTRDSIDSDFEYQGNKYTLVDTAGLRRKKKIYENIERYSVVRTLSAIDRADICVAVIDATEGVTAQDSKIIGYAHDNGKAIIIAVNKWDLIEKDNSTTRRFEEEIRRVLPFVSYAPIIFVSAKTGQRLMKLMDMIEAVNNNYSMRISTGVLNEIINKAVLMNQAPSDKGKQGKIYYATQIAIRPPKFLLHVNDPLLIHFSYTRYLENQIRDNFGFLGTPIILELKKRAGLYK
ncbi:MAG: ribosome biogenesis GTPase Der [Tissierellia bacterium]|nr:ribosome biogenesis GTPase Der [Tissierellia bacterium]